MQTQFSPFAIDPPTAVRSLQPTKLQPDRYPEPKYLARIAAQALIDEAELTPKPGLVDRRGSGSHNDLSLELLVTSARILEPFFQLMAEESQRESVPALLRITLGKLGRDAESAMLNATNGVNTHRGAIWSLGLLTVSAAVQLKPDPILVCVAAGRIARLQDPYLRLDQPREREPWRTEAAFGARREAFTGFPHIRSISLPALRYTRAMGVPEAFARLDALLAIMSTLSDTCILRRGGSAALAAVQQGAKRVGYAGGSFTSAGATELSFLEQTMLRLWVSPGGSADLLAATLFVDRITSLRVPAK